MLKEFAWKLHSESSDPFQLEASVTIHRKRKAIIGMLLPCPSEVDAVGTQESSLGDGEMDDELSSRAPFKKSRANILGWVGTVESVEPMEAFQILQYEEFIRESDAYDWLLTKIHQYGQLDIENSNVMLEIGRSIRNKLRAQEPLRKMSTRNSPALATMTFDLDWNPVRFLFESGFNAPLAATLPRIICLTGSWNEAQAMTVIDYMDQTWGQSGRALISLLKELTYEPEGKECCYQIPERPTRRRRYSSGPVQQSSKIVRLTAIMSSSSRCSISVTGGPYFISEVGEQIAWLASALRPSLCSQGVVTCTPRIEDLRVTIQSKGTASMRVIGSCSLLFELGAVCASNTAPGFCWDSLFCGSVLVLGYPILRRSEPKTGLEMSLHSLGDIIGSEQVVQWDKRILMKGFNILMVATLTAIDIIVWHILVGEKPDERISYIDPRLDALDIDTSKEVSLRMLGTKRHIVGWCTEAKDLCGDAAANHDIRASGLCKPPASVIIDRLYLGAWNEVMGGLNMSINKKDKPFWLQRENDYPSLLKWVSAQPIVFYDVADRRAWLVDGASALLHLIRTSLYLDESDPESTYDWVFDDTKLKDKWDGLTGRQAALETLKRWENLALDVYIVGKRRGDNGVVETEYSTFETRVKKILFSIETLVDKQAAAAAQDGIQFQQALKRRRDIIGYDIMDIINPLGPIHPRIQHLNSKGHGWIDFTNFMGATTIFGRGIGDLICPEEAGIACQKWKNVPKGWDYMATSVSTLRMLYGKRLLRIEPDLIGGDVSSKIVWTSPNPPFKHCKCFQQEGEDSRPRGVGTTSTHIMEGGACHDPVQFLAKKPRRGMALRGAAPVDLMALDERGAVVFGHLPLLGLQNEEKPKSRQYENDEGASSSSTEGVLRSFINSSATSERIGSTGSTGITVPSLGMVSSGGEKNDDNGKNNGREVGKRKRSMWNLKIWKRM